MKRGIDGSVVWTALLGAFVVLCIAVAREFPPELRILPYITGYGTLALIVILLLGARFPGILRWTEATLQDVWGGSGGREVPDEGSDGQVPWPAVLRSMGYAVGFFAAVFLLGFVMVTPVFIAGYLIIEARVRLFPAIAAAVMASLILVVGMQLLNVDVWTGVAPPILPGYIGGALMPPL